MEGFAGYIIKWKRNKNEYLVFDTFYGGNEK